MELAASPTSTVVPNTTSASTSSPSARPMSASPARRTISDVVNDLSRLLKRIETDVRKLLELKKVKQELERSQEHMRTIEGNRQKLVALAQQKGASMTEEQVKGARQHAEKLQTDFAALSSSCDSLKARAETLCLVHLDGVQTRIAIDLFDMSDIDNVGKRLLKERELCLQRLQQFKKQQELSMPKPKNLPMQTQHTPQTTQTPHVARPASVPPGSAGATLTLTDLTEKHEWSLQRVNKCLPHVLDEHKLSLGKDAGGGEQVKQLLAEATRQYMAQLIENATRMARARICTMETLLAMDSSLPIVASPGPSAREFLAAKVREDMQRMAAAKEKADAERERKWLEAEQQLQAATGPDSPRRAQLRAVLEQRRQQQATIKMNQALQQTLAATAAKLKANPHQKLMDSQVRPSAPGRLPELTLSIRDIVAALRQDRHYYASALNRLESKDWMTRM